jgi:hypothetical protein
VKKHVTFVKKHVIFVSYVMCLMYVMILWYLWWFCDIRDVYVMIMWYIFDYVIYILFVWMEQQKQIKRCIFVTLPSVKAIALGKEGTPGTR